MKLRRALLYLKAAFAALFQIKLTDFSKLLSRSPYTVKNIRVTNTPELEMSMIVSTRDMAISKPILWLGEYEQGVTQVLLKFLREDTHFLDVGANIGYFSLIAGKRCSQGKVFSFEPDPTNYDLLSSNIALNSLSNIHSYNLALSDRDENLYFSTMGFTQNLGARFTAKETATLKQHSLPTAEAPRQIKAISFDSFLPKERIDIIKIDVEGFELNVLQGMKELLRQQQPLIITEFAPSNLKDIGRIEPIELFDFVIRLGYQVAIVELNGNLTTCNSEHIYQEIMSHLVTSKRHHLDLLLKHPEQQ